ncbi:MAG: response regulator [Gammaproteobacteria bacterium SHHR-1]|uniref:response regulator n=1 Tax=Magnetovirga frankeli TaxID=947516 RepID=UPI0012939323|nr:response regulator [gamma proteobacterium SS-5]
MLDDKEGNEGRPLVSVALADDDSSTRYLLQSLLNRNGCKVMAAKADGTGLMDAYQHLRAINRAPDIILLDISMPGAMNGIDVLKAILEIDPNAFVIMISGETDAEVVKEVIASGASGFIVKPFTVGRIRDMIQSYRKKAGL